MKNTVSISTSIDLINNSKSYANLEVNFKKKFTKYKFHDKVM